MSQSQLSPQATPIESHQELGMEGFFLDVPSEIIQCFDHFITVRLVNRDAPGSTHGFEFRVQPDGNVAEGESFELTDFPDGSREDVTIDPIQFNVTPGTHTLQLIWTNASGGAVLAETTISVVGPCDGVFANQIYETALTFDVDGDRVIDTEEFLDAFDAWEAGAVSRTEINAISAMWCAECTIPEEFVPPLNADLLEVQDCSVNPRKAPPGSEINFSATIRNGNPETAMVTATWRVGLRDVRADPVPIGSGQSETITESGQFDSSGDVKLELTVERP